jgi:hypothetical protein
LNALIEGDFGKIDGSATVSGEYDSRVFGISSKSFAGAKSASSPLIASSELVSEDDFIIRFSPALHFTKKLRWFSFTGTAGIEFAQYIKNNDLPDKDNKKIIKPNNALKSLLNVKPTDEVTYFNLQKYMNRHFIKA